MSPSKESLDQLASVAQELNEKSDGLNATIEQVEARLGLSRIGIAVWLCTCIDGVKTDAGVEEGWDVGYFKIGDTWRLAARHVRWRNVVEDDGTQTVDDEPLADPVALVRAPRSIRVQAAPLLEVVVDRLVRQAREFVDNIDRASAFAKVYS
jgi:hypothetical protein